MFFLFNVTGGGAAFAVAVDPVLALAIDAWFFGLVSVRVCDDIPEIDISYPIVHDENHHSCVLHFSTIYQAF